MHLGQQKQSSQVAKGHAHRGGANSVRGHSCNTAPGRPCWGATHSTCASRGLGTLASLLATTWCLPVFLTPFTVRPTLKLCALAVSWFGAPFVLFGLADASEDFDLDYLLDFPLLTAPYFASWNS